MRFNCSNNTNKLSPQEHPAPLSNSLIGSNNTNKLSPQEPNPLVKKNLSSSNNTNKLSPQEPICHVTIENSVQIIQINLVLKNLVFYVQVRLKFK